MSEEVVVDTLKLTANTYFVTRAPLTFAEACVADARQREQRQQFQARAPPASRLAPTNPYLQDPSVTAERLARRRKFEILHFPATRTRNWSRLVGLRGGAFTGGDRFKTRLSPPLTGAAAVTGYTECDASGIGAGPFVLNAADFALPLYPAPQTSGAFADVRPKRLAVLYTTEVAAVPPPTTPPTANDPLTGTNPCTWAALRFQRAVFTRNPALVFMRVPLGIRLRGMLPVGVANRSAQSEATALVVSCAVALFFNDTCVLRTETRTRRVVLQMTAPSVGQPRGFVLRQLFGVLSFTVLHAMVPDDAVLTARVELVEPIKGVSTRDSADTGGWVSKADLIVNLAPGWRDAVKLDSEDGGQLILTDSEEPLVVASTELLAHSNGTPIADQVQEFF
jgi:hypothetical protein